MKSRFSHVFSYFLGGFFALLPLAVTLYLVRLMFRIVAGVLGHAVAFIPVTSYWLKLLTQIGAAIVLFLFIAGIGLFLKTFAGRGLLKAVDALIQGIPGLGSVYKAIRQVIDLVAGKSERPPMRPVMVEYMGPGNYGIGFLTSTGHADIAPDKSTGYSTVYIPTTPNPTTGFMVVVPNEKVRPLDMPADEAIKLILTGGIARK